MDEKDLKRLSETLAIKVVGDFPQIDFDYNYLKACIVEAIENAIK